MKTLLFVFFLTMVITAPVVAQEKSDVFKPETEITWLGLDFTDAKLIGDRERYGSESDIRHLVDSWNEIFIKEADKYDVADAIDKKKVAINLDVTKENNATLDVLAMYSDQEKDHLHLDRERVFEIIANYDFKGLHGIGLMFNVESFNKINVEGTLWVTFINMDTKEVLFTERMAAPPGGFGMRNFWAGAVYKILERIKKKEFEMWRKKYYRP